MVDSNETEKIVNNFYLEILGRDADSDGLKYFSEKLSKNSVYDHLVFFPNSLKSGGEVII